MERGGFWVIRTVLTVVLLLSGVLSFAQASGGSEEAVSFKAMAWNIWRGGREDGAEVGPQRVVDVIRDSGADIVAMQETYGSGELISEALGFHFHPRGTNVSIHSRYPVLEDLSVFEEFKCVGALVELPNGKKLAFYSIWLPYDGEIWEEGTRNVNDVASLLAACRSSAVDLEKIRGLISERLKDEKYRGVPVVIAGDFNSMSHLDYARVSKDQFQAVVEWPTTKVLMDVGFRDSYREVNPVVDRVKDRTWTPRFPKQEQDRIDFIFYAGAGLQALRSENIDSHAVKFPSDHSAVVTEFRYDPAAKPLADVKMNVVSYNIRHGRGMDNQVDLARTAGVLRGLSPDVVGLQEIDMNVTRSGGANQMRELGRMLGMHAVFGAFMPLQGGEYGMGILSRYPLKTVTEVKLPQGNEPRVALAAEVQLPSGEAMMVVNVHFDWVRDDGFRFAQASALAEYLKGLTIPYVLLGDFNDRPGSRTLELFQGLALEAKKPEGSSFTFSSTEPRQEIDFIFGAPKGRWTVGSVRVVDEKEASDHLPVVAEMTLKGEAS